MPALLTVPRSITAMSNRERFRATLAAQYTDLFANDPHYADAATRTTPEAFAVRMIDTLLADAALLTGSALKRTCAALGITCQQKAIVTFLHGASTDGR
jgi:hypothetical protein